VGSTYQRKREERDVTLRGFARLGLRPDSELGRRGPRRPFLFSISFQFSFSYFLFLFQSFAKMLQITSNRFLTSSNK
jgi:hypothetical protein